MEFTLYYRGDLRSNGTPKDKHELRRHFHAQLARLWGEPPLKQATKLLDPSFGEASLIRKMHGFNFAPLITGRLGMVAELDIFLLWPSPPGSILKKSGGDIDNRLKTLFDALKYPWERNSLPPGSVPLPGEDPFYCLLEDDSLITRLSVETDRLLEPDLAPSVVVLTIRVRTRRVGNEFHLHPVIGLLG
jgi:hypothetical protein